MNPAFPADDCYQACIERWNTVYDCYQNGWSDNLYHLARHVAPLTQTPWGTFRKILAELWKVRGQFDPEKVAHLAIFLDVLGSAFVLWAILGRDIRRFYEPGMEKTEFEKVLRYYLWGGKESYDIRRQMREKSTSENGGMVELPAWNALVSFAGLVVSAPQSIFECAHVCRELSIRAAVASNTGYDKALSERLKANSRIRQFSTGLSAYLVTAGGLPNDMAKRVQTILFEM